VSIATRLLDTSSGAQVSSALTGRLTTPSAKTSFDNLSMGTVVLPASMPTWDSIDCNGYNNWVAVGYSLTERCIYSLDNGETWTVATMPDANGYQNVVFGGDGYFYANAANSGVVAKSLTGATWTTQTITTSGWYGNCTKSNGVYMVMIAYNSATAACRSNTGDIWSDFSLPNNGTWMNLSVSRNRFWVTQSSGSNAASSVDGTTWTARTKPTTGYWSGGYGSDTTFIIHEGGNATGYYSTDGISWTSTTFPSAANWSHIIFNGTYWVLVSSGTEFATSTNGTTWTARTKPTGTIGGLGLSRSTGRVIAVGYNNERAYIFQGK
jgi:hypothetical protein